MIIAEGVYTLLNDIWFEALRFIIILALVILAIVLGAKLRKLHDRKKAAKELLEAADTASNTTVTEATKTEE